MIDKFFEMEGIYETFGLDDEPDYIPYIAVGVERREFDDNRLDAYILIGFKVRVGAHCQVELNDVVQAELDYWLCKENTSLALEADNFLVLQNDVVQVEWLNYIIWDMEDSLHQGDIVEIVE